MSAARCVLGIDPGYGRMGYAVLSGQGPEVALLDVGCIETSATFSHAVRLNQIAQALRALVEQYRPSLVAIESLYFSKNQTTAIGVAEARGVALAVAGAFEVQVCELGPRQVKQALTGYGNAPKEQVHDMVLRVLGRTQAITPDDAADAVAIGLTGLHIPPSLLGK